jgi:hypothetical protein
LKRDVAEVSVLGERAAMVPSAGILLITDILFVAGREQRSPFAQRASFPARSKCI